MKFKKLITGICVLAVAVTATMPVFALQPSEAKLTKMADNVYVTIEETAGIPMKGMHELTEEQKAEMEAKMSQRKAEMEAEMAAAKAKWDALTDAQKEEIYQLREQAIDLEIKTIEKQAELGLMDKAQATDMVAKMTEQKAKLREGNMMFGFGHGMAVKIRVENPNITGNEKQA